MRQTSEAWVIGAGPSLTAEDCEIIRKRQQERGAYVICANRAIELCPWADALIAVDRVFFTLNKDLVRGLSGVTINVGEWGDAIDTDCDIVRWRWDRRGRRQDNWGICLDPGVLAWNTSSGHHAINIAAHLSAKKVCLLGMDCREASGRSWHFHKDYRTNTRLPISMWAENHAAIASAAHGLGIEIVNYSRVTGIDCYPRAMLDEL